MPVYEYKCGNGHHLELYAPIEAASCDVGQACPMTAWSEIEGEEPTCGSPLKRRYSVHFNSVMQEHYNHSVGKPISSMRQFKDELKRSSDRASERTGITHDFQPADPNEGMED